MQYTVEELKNLAGKSYSFNNETIVVTNQGYIKYGHNKYTTLNAALDAVAYKLGRRKNTLRAYQFKSESGNMGEDLKRLVGKVNPASVAKNKLNQKADEAVDEVTNVAARLLGLTVTEDIRKKLTDAAKAFIKAGIE